MLRPSELVTKIHSHMEANDVLGGMLRSLHILSIIYLVFL